jgi:hypothetical protein
MNEGGMEVYEGEVETERDQESARWRRKKQRETSRWDGFC